MKPVFKDVYLAACEMFFDQAEHFFHVTGKEELDECDLIIAALSAHLLEAMNVNGTKELSVKSDSNGEEKELSIQLNDVAKQVIH